MAKCLARHFYMFEAILCWQCIEALSGWKRCHKILGTPIKIGTLGPHFPGEMGTPMGKWGPPTIWLPRVSRKPHLDLSHRYLSTKCIKWNNPVAVCQSKSRMEMTIRQNKNTSPYNIHRYTIYIAIFMTAAHDYGEILQAWINPRCEGIYKLPS